MQDNTATGRPAAATRVVTCWTASSESGSDPAAAGSFWNYLPAMGGTGRKGQHTAMWGSGVRGASGGGWGGASLGSRPALLPLQANEVPMNAIQNPPDSGPPARANIEIDRRAVLKSLAAAGALAVPGLGIAACGGSSAPAPSSSAPVKKGWTRRGALTGGSSADTLDAQSAITTVDFARIFQLNEPLIGFGPDAHLVRVLAEELTPSSDATSWVVRVRSGVTFHNGKPLTADDVIYSLQRVVNPKAPLRGVAPLAAVDVAGMKNLDSRTVRTPCHTPYAILDQTLANYYYNIVPEGYDPKAPVGTGPFKFTSFTPGQESVFERYASYWRNGQPYLGRVVITDFADEASQLNALTSSQADMVNQLSSAGGRTLQASGSNVVISNGGGWVPFTMRVDVPPFNDARVRQAMRLLVNRPQMLNAVFGGHGTVGND